jgi:hypothetical protein
MCASLVGVNEKTDELGGRTRAFDLGLAQAVRHQLPNVDNRQHLTVTRAMEITGARKPANKKMPDELGGKARVLNLGLNQARRATRLTPTPKTSTRASVRPPEARRRPLEGYPSGCPGLYTVSGRAFWDPILARLSLCALFRVAPNLLWCDHDYPRWGAHTSESIATYSVLDAPESIMGSEFLQFPL